MLIRPIEYTGANLPAPPPSMTYSLPLGQESFAPPQFFLGLLKQAEEELRRSEAFLAQGQRISHTGRWRWQVGTGVLNWSDEHFRIFGYDPETVTPSYSRFIERIHPEDRVSFETVLNQAV